jgi:lipopolysaccharide export system permease protein
MTVIAGCGISQLQLLRPLVVVAVLLAIIMGFFSFVIIPQAKRAATYLTEQAEKTSEITGISPGRFQESNDGQRVIYVKDVDEEAAMVDRIFVYSRGKDKTENLIIAETAYQQIEEGTGDKLIILNNGYRYIGTPGTTNFRTVKYEKHWVRAEEGEQNTVRAEYETKPTMELLVSDHPFDRAEFHWRLAMMVSPLLFTLIGLPLGRLRQREGRYGRVMAGVLIYIVYFKLLQVGQVMIEKGSMPSWLGLWWVHLGLFVYFAWSMHLQNSVKSGGILARIRLARAK